MFGMLCIGIYRVKDPTGTEPTASSRRYVITNPPGDFILMASDLIFVLLQFDPGLEYHNKSSKGPGKTYSPSRSRSDRVAALRQQEQASLTTGASSLTHGLHHLTAGATTGGTGKDQNIAGGTGSSSGGGAGSGNGTGTMSSPVPSSSLRGSRPKPSKASSMHHQQSSQSSHHTKTSLILGAAKSSSSSHMMSSTNTNGPYSFI